MKRLSIILIVFGILATGPASSGAQNNGTRIGLGLGVTSPFTPDFLQSEYGALMSTISIPITGSKVRIEPMIGFVRTSDGNDQFDVTQSGLRLGTGIFGLKRSGSTLFYFGGRAGIMRNSVSYDIENDPPFGPEDESTTDYFVAPATGVEYLFADTFSLGGEVQLVYTRFGQPDSDESDMSSSAMHTKTVFFVRWHF